MLWVCLSPVDDVLDQVHSDVRFDIEYSCISPKLRIIYRYWAKVALLISEDREQEDFALRPYIPYDMQTIRRQIAPFLL